MADGPHEAGFCQQKTPHNQPFRKDVGRFRFVGVLFINKTTKEKEFHHHLRFPFAYRQ